jgi:acetate kinase
MLAATGFSNDMRDVEAAVLDTSHPHHANAVVAFKMFIKRIADFICIYAGDIINETGQTPHAIAFTAGIGENSSLVRELVAKRLSYLVKIDEEKNNTRGTVDITHPTDNAIKVFVIPTEEELMIARDTYKLSNAK